MWPQYSVLVYLLLCLNKTEHKQPYIRAPQQLHLLSEVFLDCVINPLLRTFSGGASVSLRLLPLVCVKWRVFLNQQLILTKFNRPGNIKGVACFKKQTELYPYKCRSKSRTSSTFTFNRVSNISVKELTICLGLWSLC